MARGCHHINSNSGRGTSGHLQEPEPLASAGLASSWHEFLPLDIDPQLTLGQALGLGVLIARVHKELHASKARLVPHDLVDSGLVLERDDGLLLAQDPILLSAELKNDGVDLAVVGKEATDGLRVVLVLLLGLMGAEWLVRRRKGLA